jgi:hypothetical protein
MAFILSSLFASPAFAITYENSTTTGIKDTKAYCYNDDARDVVSYTFANYLDINCTGTFISPPDNCLRELKIDNIDNKRSQITVEIDPTPLNLPCPAPPSPAVDKVWVKFAPDGDDGKAQTQFFDMNECWGWWCGSSTGYNKTVCPFDWMWLNTFGACHNITVSWIDAKKDCPKFRFDISSNIKWANISWGWYSGNTQNVEFETDFIGLSTSQRVKVVQTDYEQLVKSAPTYQVLEQNIGSLMQMNSSFVTVIYMIAETIILILVVIGLPAVAILMIKYIWEKITGRPLGGRK